VLSPACPRAPDAKASVWWPSSGGQVFCRSLCASDRWSPDASGDPVSGGLTRARGFRLGQFLSLCDLARLTPCPRAAVPSPPPSKLVLWRPRSFPPHQIFSKAPLFPLLTQGLFSCEVVRVWVSSWNPALKVLDSMPKRS